MPHDLRESKQVDYKQLHSKGLTDGEFDVEKEMTPVKSRSLKAENLETEIKADDSSDGDSDDEELMELRKELEMVQKLRKEQKAKEKKEKIRKEIEKGKKELKKNDDKTKGEKIKSVNAKKSVKIEDSSVNINDLRKCSTIKAKAESAVKKILELSSDDSSDERSDSSSNADSDDLYVSKRSKRNKSKSKKKSGIFDHPSDEVVKKQMWPQSKLQFEYAGSKINFDDLEFNLFVAGELEILLSAKVSEIERIGRTILMK